jgi:prophage DNA circulation protein
MIPLLRASFKGVPFLFKQSSVSSGRLTVDYQYPYRELQQSKDMGAAIRVYSLDVSTFGLGDDYNQNRKRLIEAFQSSGDGVFIHPIDGSVRAQIESFTINESIAKLGVAEFNVTLKATSLPQYPIIADSGKSNVDNIFQKNLDILKKAFEDIWSGVIKFEDEINKYTNYIDQLANGFENVTNLVTTSKNVLTPFKNSLKNLKDQASESAVNPKKLSTNILDVFDKMKDLSENTTDRSNMNTSFFNYESTGKVDIKTVSSVNIEKNRKSLDMFINLVALTYEYLNTSNITYTIENNIQTQSKVLDNQYYKSLNNNYYESLSYDTGVPNPTSFNITLTLTRNSIINENDISSITANRDYVSSYLNAQLTNSKRVTTIKVYNDSLIALVYRLYGNLDLYETILSLNQIANPSYLNGEVKILES